MREKLTLLGPLILIPLAVVLTMLALEPPPKTPKIVFFVEPTATITPRPTSTPIPPTSTFTPTALPTTTSVLAATDTAPSAAVDRVSPRTFNPSSTNTASSVTPAMIPPRGLQLDSYEHLIQGATYRVVVIPGNPDES